MRILSRRGLMMALIGITLWSTAFWWILTSANHPDATTFRTVKVWFQAILGVAVTALGWWYDRLEKMARPGSGEG